MRGTGDFFRGVRILLSTRRLWPYVWIPVLINTVVYALVVGAGVYFFGDLMQLLLPVGDAWYVSVLRFFGWIVFSVVIVFGIYLTFFVVATIIASPFNEMLSAKYEELKTGRKVAEGLGVMAAVWQEVKRLVLYLVALGALVLVTSVLSVIPVLNLVVPVLWALFTGFVSALEFLSYTFDRRGMSLRAKFSYMRRTLGRCQGFGLAVAGAMMIPVLNLAVIPCAVVGATHLYLETGLEVDPHKGQP